MKLAINCKKSDSIHVTFMDDLIDILNTKNVDFIINDDIEDFNLVKKIMNN